jgi:prepilin-type N-terminal cleavage/methylation domain-containing protein
MMRRRSSLSSSEAAFTLVELLVVISIIVLMAALGVSAFKGGAASDGTRGASYLASTVFDAARNEAIMRRVPVRVIFDTSVRTSGSATPDTAFRRMTVAYTTNNGTSWTQSGRWIKFPANAYFDSGSAGNWQSRGYTPMTSSSLSSGFGIPTVLSAVAYEYLPNGQANYSGVTTQPLKVVFSPGMLSSGTFIERPDKKSLYGFVVNKLGHTQQFADLNSLMNCP